MIDRVKRWVFLWPWVAGLLLGQTLECGAADMPPFMVIEAALASVGSVDIATEGSRIHAVLAGRPRVGGSAAMYYLRSDDGGMHWQPPRRIDPEGGPTVEAKAGNGAQIAASGQNLVAAWQQRGEFPGVGPVAVAYSLDGGLSWRLGENPAPGDATRNQSHIDLVADNKGRFHIVWLDDRAETGDAQGLHHAFSGDGGQHWQGEATVDGRVCTCCWSRMALLGNGDLSVLYRDEAPRDMALARYRAGQWRSLGAVGTFNWQFQGCPHCGGGLAAVRNALHSVVWTGAEGRAGLYYLRSANGGAVWTRPHPIGGPHARVADIAAASRQDLAIAYTERGEGGMQLLAVRSVDGGVHWSAPSVIAPAPVQPDVPRVAAVPDGFRVFWTESDGSGGRRWRTVLL